MMALLTNIAPIILGFVAKLFSRVDETNRCIQKINNSMLQIKWSVYGAIGFYIITQIGLLEALRVI